MIAALFICGSVMWMIMFFHACVDIFFKFKRGSVVAEKVNLVNWTVHDYGTDLQGEYCDDGV